jgi:hypothetical protein
MSKIMASPVCLDLDSAFARPSQRRHSNGHTNGHSPGPPEYSVDGYTSMPTHTAGKGPAYARGECSDSPEYNVGHGYNSRSPQQHRHSDPGGGYGGGGPGEYRGVGVYSGGVKFRPGAPHYQQPHGQHPALSVNNHTVNAPLSHTVKKSADIFAVGGEALPSERSLLNVSGGNGNLDSESSWEGGSSLKERLRASAMKYALKILRGERGSDETP